SSSGRAAIGSVFGATPSRSDPSAPKASATLTPSRGSSGDGGDTSSESSPGCDERPARRGTLSDGTRSPPPRRRRRTRSSEASSAPGSSLVFGPLLKSPLLAVTAPVAQGLARYPRPTHGACEGSR